MSDERRWTLAGDPSDPMGLRRVDGSGPPGPNERVPAMSVAEHEAALARVERERDTWKQRARAALAAVEGREPGPVRTPVYPYQGLSRSEIKSAYEQEVWQEDVPRPDVEPGREDT